MIFTIGAEEPIVHIGEEVVSHEGIVDEWLQYAIHETGIAQIV